MKLRLLEIPPGFLLITPGKSTLFFKKTYFFNTLGNFISATDRPPPPLPPRPPHVWSFSGKVHCKIRLQRLFFAFVLKRDPKLHINHILDYRYTICMNIHQIFWTVILFIQCTSVKAVFYHLTLKIQSPVRSQRNSFIVEKPKWYPFINWLTIQK